MCSGIAVLAGLKFSAKPTISPVFASQNGRCRFRLVSVAKPTIIGWLLIAKPADVVPPGSTPKSVMIICAAPAAYLIDGTCPAFIIALSARLMTPATSLIVFIVV